MDWRKALEYTVLKTLTVCMVNKTCLPTIPITYFLKIFSNALSRILCNNLQISLVFTKVCCDICVQRNECPVLLPRIAAVSFLAAAAHTWCYQVVAMPRSVPLLNSALGTAPSRAFHPNVWPTATNTADDMHTYHPTYCQYDNAICCNDMLHISHC